jgi:hypothetical protein
MRSDRNPLFLMLVGGFLFRETSNCDALKGYYRAKSDLNRPSEGGICPLEAHVLLKKLFSSA